MNKIKNIYLLALIATAVLPINGTNSPLNNNYILSIRWDYILHALVYIPLLPLLMLGQKQATNTEQQIQHTEPQYLKYIILSISIAISLEGIQCLIDWRTFNVNDLVSNVLGVFLGLIVIKIFSNKISNHVKQ